VSIAWDSLALANWEAGRYEASLDATRHLISARPDIAEARRLQPQLSLALVQSGFGVSGPEIDARRNAALRQVGVE